MRDLVTDEHIKVVLEFMQANVPASKLCGVAESLPQMGKLLWGRIPQEPVTAMFIGGSQPTASGCAPERLCVGDDSEAARVVPAHQ
jgi:hypothetical protein